MADWVPLGRFRMIRRLATGGMADIFLATGAGEGPGGEALYVVKRVLPHLAEDPMFVRMFLDEARVASMLRHPGIVRMVEFGQDGSKPFYAMEHLVGEDLRAVLAAARRSAQPIPAVVAASIIARAAEALHHAHQLRGADGQPLHVVHRDVSPSNLFVTYSGAVKVLDFGLARWKERLHKTDAGQRRGKPSYMAPEQSGGGAVDHRADVFSLGLCLEELLADLGPKRPEVLASIVGRALQLKPEDRYPTADALRKDLDAWLSTLSVQGPSAVASFMRELFGDEHLRAKEGDVGPVTATGQLSGVSPKSPGSRPRGRGRVLFVAGGVALVVACVAVGVALRQPPKSSAPSGVGWWTLTANVPAQVWIDQSAVGGLPLRHFQLSAGEHQVVLRNDALGLERRVTAAIDAGRETIQSESFAKGTLEIQAEPGTRVWVDGQSQGTSPMSPVSVWEGRHTLTLQRADHQERVTVNVVPGATTHVRPTPDL